MTQNPGIYIRLNMESKYLKVLQMSFMDGPSSCSPQPSLLRDPLFLSPSRSCHPPIHPLSSSSFVANWQYQWGQSLIIEREGVGCKWLNIVNKLSFFSEAEINCIYHREHIPLGGYRCSLFRCKILSLLSLPMESCKLSSKYAPKLLSQYESFVLSPKWRFVVTFQRNSGPV